MTTTRSPHLWSPLPEASRSNGPEGANGHLFSGLAAREGFASPEKMLESVSKVTGREAAQLVSLALPWDAPITTAMAAGSLSVDCAGALRRGLGRPTEQVDPDTLRELAERLVLETGELSADRAYTTARLERDLIDTSGVKARQQELYERGGFRLYAKANGHV